MTLEKVKQFLKVDFDDDDTLIELIMEAAEEYITGAVGTCDFKKARVKLLFLNIVSNMYENRQYAVNVSNNRLSGATNGTSSKLSWITNSLLLQLQLENDDF